MGGPYQRNEQDDTGRRIDAAERVLTAAKREVESLQALSDTEETVTALLYSVIIAWADEQVTRGGCDLTEEEREYGQIQNALISLEHKARWFNA